MTITEAQSIIDLLGQPERPARTQDELKWARFIVDTHAYRLKACFEDEARKEIVLARYRRSLTMIAADILANS